MGFWVRDSRGGVCVVCLVLLLGLSKFVSVRARFSGFGGGGGGLIPFLVHCLVFGRYDLMDAMECIACSTPKRWGSVGCRDSGGSFCMFDWPMYFLLLLCWGGCVGWGGG